PEETLVVAVPKGRVLEQLVPRFERVGFDVGVLTKKSRKLIREDAKRGLRFLLLKPDDVPTYVEYGAADLGVVGRDVLLEREYDLYAPLDLGIGRCRLAVAGLSDVAYPPPPGKTLRVATKFPNVATRHFQAKGQPVEMIFVQGSVELAPLTGLADVIVDIVETGETLRQNGLAVLEDIHEVSSVLVANRVGLKLKRERIAPLLEALREE
ncbi:MAG TPA: ATP phosphoribosyltransferase, partial [Polyangiaceae bacterium LLY-WYZ-15_(1-7)]|nr:ATP phosphoribosyltransferase [Polyangiaceae bacterium LLY-WYZ-15_(1-7)]